GVSSEPCGMPHSAFSDLVDRGPVFAYDGAAAVVLADQVPGQVIDIFVEASIGHARGPFADALAEPVDAVMRRHPAHRGARHAAPVVIAPGRGLSAVAPALAGAKPDAVGKPPLPSPIARWWPFVRA